VQPLVLVSFCVYDIMVVSVVTSRWPLGSLAPAEMAPFLDPELEMYSGRGFGPRRFCVQAPGHSCMSACRAEDIYDHQRTALLVTI
jgi:hypothetical protein